VKRLAAALLFLAVSGLCLASAEATAALGFPTTPPVRERVFRPDDQSAWTLRTADQAVPLVVVPSEGGIVVGLTGGWLILGPDLDILPNSFDWMASSSPGGSPWAQPANGAIVYVSGSPGSLAVLYPETAVVRSIPFALSELDDFALTDQGFLFVEGRRVSQMAFWGADLRESQPLPFFAADVSAADDGTAWAVDSLQARPWRRDDGLWSPLNLPQSPGRMTSLVPFPDSSGYFGSGPGWVGAFNEDGKAYWTKSQDLTGQALPLDIRVSAGPERLYLWSAQARKIWNWGWNADGPAGTVGAPSLDTWQTAIQSEITRLESLGSIPEAQAVAQYGTQFAAAILKLHPFDTKWTTAQAGFQAAASALRTKIVGAGTFTLSWSQPFDAPLATWTWQPDATWLGVKTWRVHVLPFWEGRAYEPEDFKIPLSGDRAVWPGVNGYPLSSLQLPSWMNLEFRADDKPDVVNWTRQPLPAPPKPYDFPVE